MDEESDDSPGEMGGAARREGQTPARAVRRGGVEGIWRRKASIPSRMFTLACGGPARACRIAYTEALYGKSRHKSNRNVPSRFPSGDRENRLIPVAGRQPEDDTRA